MSIRYHADKIIDFNLGYSKINKKNIASIMSIIYKNLGSSVNAYIKTKKLKPYAVFARAASSMSVISIPV